MRVIIAGGGTGGHVIPALAIAHELRTHYSAQVLFIGTARGMETRLVPEAGFDLELVEVGALKNVSLTTRLKTLTALPRAVLRSWSIIRKFNPDVVIGVGGYASGPGMLAAALSGRTTMVFEPNVVPGFANRMVAPLVRHAAVQFQESCRYFRHSTVTGVPVRAEFFNLPPRDEKSPPSLLVFGGSQGASAINKAILAALPALGEQVPGIHVVHQTGERDFEAAQAAYQHAPMRAEVSQFIHRMPEAFAQADLLVCRSGASTVGEVTAAGKPAIFIPFPRAADDHQTRNAEALVNAGAALLLPESQLSPEKIVALITELLRDRPRLRKMAEAARGLSHPNAARDIAALAALLAGIPLSGAQAS